MILFIPMETSYISQILPELSTLFIDNLCELLVMDDYPEKGVWRTFPQLYAIFNSDKSKQGQDIIQILIKWLNIHKNRSLVHPDTIACIDKNVVQIYGKAEKFRHIDMCRLFISDLNFKPRYIHIRINKQKNEQFYVDITYHTKNVCDDRGQYNIIKMYMVTKSPFELWTNYDSVEELVGWSVSVPYKLIDFIQPGPFIRILD